MIVAICAFALAALASCGADDDHGASAPVRIGDPAPAAQGQWRAVSPMNVERLGHTATLLATGQVLVAGGFNFGGTIATAELYDPSSGKWTATGSMNVVRSGHTATMLPSGQVLVVAGDPNSTAELYDPTTGQWTLTAPTAMPHRSAHTATLLAGGRVLVAGGYNDSASTASAATELYDPIAGRWTPVGAMVQARVNHATAALADGRVLATGGQIGGVNGGPLTNTTEIYDPATSRWTATASLTTARIEHTATLLTTGAVLVAGGPETELYDPASGRWAPAGALPESHVAHAAALLPNGTLLIAAGCDDGVGCSTPFANAASYDPVARAWTPAAPLNLGRANHTATLLPGGRLLVTGGFILAPEGGDLTASAELYDPSPGSWTTTGPLATARWQHTATLLLDGQVLVAGGGVDADSTRTASAELYVIDPATRTGTWQTTGAMQLGRVQHAAALLPSGLVLVAGGDDVAGVSAELYDPATRLWRRTGDMSGQHFYGHTMTLLPDGRVLVAGNCGVSGPPVTAELYTYDPVAKTGSWQPTGSMNAMRCSHTATLLTSGQVVVTGGQDRDSDPIASVEVYDPNTAKWTTSAPLAAPCTYGTANLLPTGQVLVVCSGSAEVFTWDAKSSTGSWQSAGSLDTTRTLFSTTTSLRDGGVLIAGGQDAIGNLTGRAARYDAASGAWTAAGPLNTARQGHSTTLLPNGQLLSAGGVTGAPGVLRSAELYDAGLGFQPAWRPVISLVAPVAVGGALGIEGTLFRGLSEASGGNTRASSTGYPVIQLMRIDNAQSMFVTVDPSAGWSDTTFTSLPLAGFAPGPALVTVFTNGIPSVALALGVQPPASR